MKNNRKFRRTVIRSVVVKALLCGVSAPAFAGVKFGENNHDERASMMGMQCQDGELLTVYPEEDSVSDMLASQ